MTIFYEKLKIPVLLNKSFNYIRPMNNSCDSKGRLSQQANRHSDRLLEVVSKPQIRFKGPAKRDYISDLKKLVYASSAGRSRKRSIHGYVSIYRRPVLHPNLKESDANPASGATQPLGLRWGFETTSKLNITRKEEEL